MMNWIEGDVTVNGIRLHYYRSGEQKPPLVFVHGFTDNALYWTRAARALEQDWEVILYDARGHGQSQRAGGHFTDADRVNDLTGVIEALRLDRPAMIGHSMGGATVALAAAQHPGLSRGIILEDPAWYEPPTNETTEAAAQRHTRQSAELDAWRTWVQDLQTGTFEEGLEKIRANNPGWAEMDAELSLNARRQVEIGLFEYFPPARSPWRSILPKITCPILLLLGDNPERSAILTVEQAREAAGLWRGGRWVQIAGAGHSIRYDQFERYLQAVRAFLQELH